MITENNDVKILSDLTIQTEREITHWQPDITAHEKNNNKFLTIDIGVVPGDSNVEGKENRKRYMKISRLS